jgi:hypothetical protein
MSSTADPWPSHRVRLDPDHGASGLWLFDENGTKFGVSLDRLDLSPELRQELRAWSDEYDQLADTDHRFPSPAARRAFHVRWRELAERLAEELGPRWRVETPFGILQRPEDR